MKSFKYVGIVFLIGLSAYIIKLQNRNAELSKEVQVKESQLIDHTKVIIQYRDSLQRSQKALEFLQGEDVFDFYEFNETSDIHCVGGRPVADGTVTSRFGYRRHPIKGIHMPHRGIDILVDENTPVYSTGYGVVVTTSFLRGYGHTVIIKHGDVCETLYAHLSDICVEKGDTLTEGTLIAHSGMTGWATNPHLHYEIRLNGEAIDPVIAYTRIVFDKIS